MNKKQKHLKNCDEQNKSEDKEKGSGFPVIIAEVTSDHICFSEW